MITVETVSVVESGVFLISSEEKIFFARNYLEKLIQSLENQMPMKILVTSNRQRNYYTVRFKQFKDHLRIKIPDKKLKVKKIQSLIDLLKLMVLDYVEGEYLL